MTVQHTLLIAVSVRNMAQYSAGLPNRILIFFTEVFNRSSRQRSRSEPRAYVLQPIDKYDSKPKHEIHDHINV